MEEEEQARCYVCLEADASLHRACACAEGRVHIHCLARTIRSVPAHAERCGVCHVPYPIAPATTFYVLLELHVGMTCALLACIGLAADGVRLLATEPHISLTLYLVLLYTGDISFFVLLWSFFRSMHGRWRWWHVRAIPAGRTLTLGHESVELDDSVARCRVEDRTLYIVLWRSTKRPSWTPPSSSASPST